jgi:hypothetical protein
MLDGRLDSGMGFESLIGAMLEINEVTTIIIKGKIFKNEKFEHVFIGKLTEKQKDFLFNNFYQ